MADVRRELRSRTIAEMLADPDSVRSEIINASGPSVAVVSSRIGHSPELQQRVAHFTSLSVAQCRRDNGVLLVASGTAIEPYLRRAAELFDVPTLSIDDVSAKSKKSQLEPNRDRILIAAADRVDAVHLRPNGTIHRAIADRLLHRNDVSTRIVVASDNSATLLELLDRGAVGWYLNDDSATAAKPGSNSADLDSDSSWIDDSDQWLIHCTRGTDDAWPGQTEHQHLDQLLLGRVETHPGSALTTLRRIVRTRILTASAIVTDRQFPVVCFSQRSLVDVIRNRRYRPHLHRWDNEPYGIAIRKSALQSRGAAPVIYFDQQTRGQCAPEDRFRLQSRGRTYDWTEEAEWRSPRSVDLRKLEKADIKVFVPSRDQAEQLASLCDWPITVTGQPSSP